MTAQAPDATPVDRVRIWFDPSCPWAWLTYRWLRQAQQGGRDFALNLEVMSLAILNEHNPDAPERYRYPHARSLQLGRVLVAASSSDIAPGNDTLAAMYDSLGTYVHDGGGRDFEHANRCALTTAGLPTELSRAALSTDYDGILRANTAEAMAIVGPDVGTPVVELGGTAYFGPILSHIPTPDEAVRMFDAVTVLAGVPYFYELKRHRSEEPDFHAP